MPAQDFKNDIIELRHTGNDAIAIKMNIIEAGKKTPLKFGKDKNIDKFYIDGPAKSSGGWRCTETVEATGSIKIQNGKIIQSECILDGKFILKSEASHDS